MIIIACLFSSLLFLSRTTVVSAQFGNDAVRDQLDELLEERGNNNGEGEEENPGDSQLDPEDVTSETFRNLNPLYIGESDYRVQLSTPRGIISRALTFAFPLGGIILFVMIVWGGFEMLSGAATKKSLDAGRERVTAAIIGFILLFSSYWIVQIVEAVFGVRIL